MAEKLSITIALNGAEEIKRQLADVGQAGKDAFAEINQAAAEVGGFNKLDTSRLSEGLVNVGLAGKDVAKVLNAVNQAGRMERLVNGIAAVENGLVKVQAAASSMDQVLLTGLTRSIGMIARLLPAAFGAATVGAIANTVTAIRELDAEAIKLGVSFQDLAKVEQIFKAIGLSMKDARSAAKGFFADQGKIEMAGVKEADANLDDFGRSLSSAKNWIKILEDGAKSANKEVAEFSQKSLARIGRAVPGISAAAEEINKIEASAAPASEKLLKILGVLEQMGPTAERTRLAERFGPAFVQALNAGGVQLEKLKQDIAALAPPSQAAADAATRVALEWQKLQNLLASGFTVSPEGLNQLAQVLATIREIIIAVGNLQTVGATLSIGGNTLRELQAIGSALTSIGNLGVSIWNGIADAAAAAWRTVIGWIDAAIEKVKQFFGMGGGQAAAGGSGGIGHAAHGGIIGGRGTGTSDSNLAWLSRGEHVMPAYAVRQPGVLALLEALRRSGGNLRGVLDRMGHFALGGMVGAPAFAAGGINGMSHVTIAFPGLPPVGGLRAPGSVVDELRKAAGLAQVRSGGRKPSRYF